MLALIKKAKGGPWLWVGTQLVKLGHRQWSALPDKDRKELRRIVRKSRGRTSNLTAKERTEGKRIVRSFASKAGSD